MARAGGIAAAAAFLLLLLVGPAAAAPDMSIISYNAEHGTRGLEERTEAEARAAYDLWLAENGRSFLMMHIANENARVVSIDGFEDVPQNDEKSLQKAVAHQPVSVAIEAGGREFQLYHSGVFSGRCGTSLDHGVVAVGYGTDNGKDYWIVRNSWGPKWGEDGYIRMDRNVNVTTGKCGIAMMASYPTKSGANPPKPSPTPPTPPPPSAPDHVCDENFSCPAGSTCCCAFGFRKMCLFWGCCPVEGATCCKDHASCCPPDYPICNTRAGTCSASKNSPLSVKALKRTLAKLNTA
ncbi:hypothetical protein E2562_005129 [Oryza meyeriana var. granulata]|uniref:Granulins domain-containing protein n=1 Tax=Oryza meyeriana var. granulata TaxID=110450 RepID=A0A6G1BT42_9ORYZ|nr:hypothetical protein E2562_005129 [Oryza meyeriana var. granulata]